MRKNISFSILLLLLSCWACNSGPQEIMEEDQYRISLPSSLKVVDDLDPKARLQFADYKKELYCSLNQTPKGELMKTLGTAKVTSEGIPDLKTYAKFMSSTFKYTVSASEIDLQQLGEKYWLEFEGETAKAKLYYQIAFAEDEDYFYQLISWTLADRKSLYQEDIKAIMESFEIL